MAFQFQQRNDDPWLKRFAVIWGVCLILIGLATWGFYNSLYRQELIQLKAELTRNLDLSEFYLKKELQDLTGDLALLSSSSVLRTYLDSPSLVARHNLEIRFSDFVNLRHHYDHIRLLAPDGKEVIRVNARPGKAVIVGDEELQDKSQRYYFEQAIALPPGVFYASPLDLNVENGVIELPYKPMIRVAMKLIDSRDQVAGVLVLNYLAENLLQGLNDIFPVSRGQIQLVNGEGFYLKGSVQEKEWGFMLPTRQEFTLAKEEPELWARIAASPRGYFFSEQGLSAFLSVNTAQFLFNPRIEDAAPQSVEQRWTLLERLPPGTISGLMASRVHSLGLSAAFMAVLSLLGAYLYARAAQLRDQFNRQSRQLVAALDECPLGLAIAGRSGTIDYVNQGLMNLAEKSSVELLGKGIFELGDAILPSEQTSSIRAAIDNELFWTGRFSATRMDQATIEKELILSPLSHDKKNAGRLILILRDVTREAELEFQLRQAQKMETIGTMAGGIAHNFNNNLAIILGNLELAQLKMQRNTVGMEYLRNAFIAAQRASDLVRKIMSYSRKEPPRFIPVQFSKCLVETLQLLRSTLPSSVKIDTHIELKDRELYVNADANQLQEAIVNICTNAVYAMGEKGTLSISFERVELQQEQIPDRFNAPPGHFVALGIEDTGCGMPAETIEKIFDPFFTTKGAADGTGIGLSTVLGTVKNHNGFIQVKSRPGHGARFELFFPTVPTPLDQTEAVEEKLLGGTESILIVDDEELLVRTFSMTLGAMGYQVAAETDSLAALERVSRDRDKYSLVITDQTMPKLTGVELLAEFHKVRPDLPILLLTGYSSKLTETEALNLGFAGYLTKPLPMPRLLQAVRDVLDRKPVTNKVEP